MKIMMETEWCSEETSGSTTACLTSRVCPVCIIYTLYRGSQRPTLCCNSFSTLIFSSAGNFEFHRPGTFTRHNAPPTQTKHHPTNRHRRGSPLTTPQSPQKAASLERPPKLATRQPPHPHRLPTSLLLLPNLLSVAHLLAQRDRQHIHPPPSSIHNNPIRNRPAQCHRLAV